MSLKCSILYILDEGSKTVDMTEEITEGAKAGTVKTKQCEDIVNQIRGDEFGVGVHLSEDGQRLMKVTLKRVLV